VLLAFVTLYYTLCRPSIRERTYPYLTKRFKGDSPYVMPFHCWRLYYNFGKALIDRAAIGIRGYGSLSHAFPAGQELLKVLGEGKGLVLLTSHVGCWQAVMPALKFLNAPINLLVEQDREDIDIHYLEHGGEGFPCTIIDPTDYMAAVIEMIQALKRSEVVCIMGDRMAGSPKGGVSVEFLGEKALFPLGPFKIAAAMGAPVAVFLTHRSGLSEYTIAIPETIRPEGTKEALAAGVQRYVRALEAYTAEHPYQFFNFYNMW
jgi:predicted LPLAT superfamily acyltransferase